ncbi:hypothetical protein BASA83_005056 [Batrachochytrium salamandrivorans]|nr:hypothetical protein BASA83_005056 [Batrachochytrium salamandrivorans]
MPSGPSSSLPLTMATSISASNAKTRGGHMSSGMQQPSQRLSIQLQSLSLADSPASPYSPQLAVGPALPALSSQNNYRRALVHSEASEESHNTGGGMSEDATTTTTVSSSHDMNNNNHNQHQQLLLQPLQEQLPPPPPHGFIVNPTQAALHELKALPAIPNNFTAASTLASTPSSHTGTGIRRTTPTPINTSLTAAATTTTTTTTAAPTPHSSTTPANHVSLQIHNGSLPKTQQERLERQAACAKSRWMTSLNTTVVWPTLFALVDHPARTPFESQLYWKLLARRLPVNQYLRSHKPSPPPPYTALPCTPPPLSVNSSLDSTSTASARIHPPLPPLPVFRGCSRCTADLESIEHVFFDCPPAQAFWAAFRLHFGAIVGMSTAELPPITLCDVILFFPDMRPVLCAEELHVLQVMHSVALWSLWGARTLPPSETLLWQSFTNRLQARISIEYDAAVASQGESDAESLLGIRSRNSYAYSLVSAGSQDDSLNTHTSSVSPATPSSHHAGSGFPIRDQRRFRNASANSSLTLIHESYATTPISSVTPSTPTASVGGFISTWCSNTISSISVTPEGLKFQKLPMPAGLA